MTADLLSQAAFAFVCLGLLAIAFGPAWREWRRPTDREPLKIPLDYSTDIEHFAQALRRQVTNALGERPLSGGHGTMLLPPTIGAVGSFDGPGPLIAKGPLTVLVPVRFKSPVYVGGDLCAAPGSVFSELLVDGAARLSANSEVRGWAHANGPLTLHADGVALRRMSSRSVIELANRCCFERLHAPVIRFGGAASARRPDEGADRVEVSFLTVPGVTRRSASLFAVQGDCRLPHGLLFRGSLVVTGRLYIGSRTRILGDIKAHRGVTIGSHAEVSGAVCCDQQVQLSHGAVAWGPVVSETLVLLGRYAQVGHIDAPTSLTAASVMAESGSVAHGSVWAREMGVVWSN